MKTLKKFFSLVLALCLMASVALTASAEEGYTYTVRFYAGKNGVFTSASKLSVPSGAHKSLSGDGTIITVTGLNYGDMVTFSDVQHSVELVSSKYYAKGVRRSGWDNNTVSGAAFEVDGDRDYVVAYGLAGDTVAYTVRYIETDDSGREVAELGTEEFYGNVGDEAVIAYAYFDGYQPRALNLTMILSADPSENVLDFPYKKLSTGNGDGTLDPDAPGGGNGGNGGGGNTVAPRPDSPDYDKEYWDAYWEEYYKQLEQNGGNDGEGNGTGTGTGDNTEQTPQQPTDTQPPVEQPPAVEPPQPPVEQPPAVVPPQPVVPETPVRTPEEEAAERTERVERTDEDKQSLTNLDFEELIQNFEQIGPGQNPFANANGMFSNDPNVVPDITEYEDLMSGQNPFAQWVGENPAAAAGTTGGIAVIIAALVAFFLKKKKKDGGKGKKSE